MRRRTFLRGSVGVTSLLLLAACAPAPSPAAPTATPPASIPTPQPTGVPAPAAPVTPTSAAKPSTTNVRVLFTGTLDPTFVPDFAAFRLLQQKYGVTADVQQISGADITIKSLVANQADVAVASLASGVLAVGQGQKIKAFSSEASAPYFTLITSADIHEWKDLQGKRIGITATSDGSYWTTVLQLKKYGVDPNAVDWVTVRGTPARVEALRAGKIDAAQVQIGGALSLLDDPGFKRMAEVGKDFPNLLFGAFWASEVFLRDHRDVLGLLAEVVMQAHRDAQDKTKYLAEAQQELTDMDAATISRAYDVVKDMNIWDPNEARWTAEAGDFAAHTLAEYEAVEKFVPFSEWATTQFSDAARQKLGLSSG
jgi:ABC-type nitrate/sulfonate/bicarbonate transport system substrate-binding protein